MTVLPTDGNGVPVAGVRGLGGAIEPLTTTRAGNENAIRDDNGRPALLLKSASGGTVNATAEDFSGGGGVGSYAYGAAYSSTTSGDIVNIDPGLITPTDPPAGPGQRMTDINGTWAVIQPGGVTAKIIEAPSGGGGTNFYQARLTRRTQFALNDYVQHTLNTSDLFALVHGATQISPITFSGMNPGDLFFISDYGYDYNPTANTGGPNTTYALCTVISVAPDGQSLVYRASAIFHKFVQYAATIELTTQEDADYISDTVFGYLGGVDCSGLTEDVTIKNAMLGGATINFSGSSQFMVTIEGVSAAAINVSGPLKMRFDGCHSIIIGESMDYLELAGCVGVNIRNGAVVSSAQINYCSNIVIQSGASVTISSESAASITDFNIFDGGHLTDTSGNEIQDNGQFGRVVNRMPPATGNYVMTSQNGVRQWVAG